MYSPVFLTDYLMNDEWYLIGSRQGLREGMKDAFFTYGRGLFGIYSTLVYRFARYDPFRIQLVRFLNFASLVAIALLLFVFLRNITKNAWFSSLVVLFLFSQRCFQGVMAYSLQLISNTQPAMWLSLVAFFVQFYFDDRWFPKPLRLVTVFVLLVLAMQSTQTYAFFSMVPLTYLALTGWKNQRRRTYEFLVLCLVVFVLSTMAYEAGLKYRHEQGLHGYRRGEEGMEALGQHPLGVILQSANPVAYWSAFEIWSYPFPFHFTAPLTNVRVKIACLVMLVWAGLLLWAVITELRESPPQERRQIALKWLMFLVCLGFGAVFVVADAPLVSTEHRPHVVMTLTGVAVFGAAYALRVVASKYSYFRRALARSFAISFIALIAFGAQAGILRGFVNNRKAQLDFIRTELMSRDPSTYQNIIVVLPKWSGCLTEPCGAWVGQVTEVEWQLTRPAGYRYALETTGIPSEGKNITFTKERPREIPEGSIVIDWQKYSSAWQAQASSSSRIDRAFRH
jgi:hypothetical protein